MDIGISAANFLAQLESDCSFLRGLVNVEKTTGVAASMGAEF